MNHDIRPSYRRTFYDRHPVLCECISIIVVCAAVCAAATAVLYAAT